MLTIAAMRVKIAQDAIKQVLKGKIELVDGYGYIELPLPKDISSIDSSDSLIPLIRKGCKACALGALFIADVKKQNGYRIRDLEKTREVLSQPHHKSWSRLEKKDITRRLKQYFSRSQLRLIEDVFEADTGIWDITYPDADQRFIAICKNIIKHDGKFCPDKA